MNTNNNNNRMMKRNPRAMHPFFRSPFLSSFWDEDIFSRDLSNRGLNNFMPAVNVSEDEKNWTIEVSAPGFKKEDFKVRLENDVLTISAEMQEEKNDEQKNYRTREFRSGSFARSFRLDREFVDEKGIKAGYENGILNVTIPKSEKASKSEPHEFPIG